MLLMEGLQPGHKPIIFFRVLDGAFPTHRAFRSFQTWGDPRCVLARETGPAENHTNTKNTVTSRGQGVVALALALHLHLFHFAPLVRAAMMRIQRRSRIAARLCASDKVLCIKPTHFHYHAAPVLR
jgi:hypothetical protein